MRAVVAREAAKQELEGIQRQKLIVTLEAVKAYLSQRQRGFRRASVASVTPPPLANAEPPELPSTLRKRPGDLTEQEIRMSLEKHRGNKTRVAAELGIAINTLKARMRTFGIDQERP